MTRTLWRYHPIEGEKEFYVTYFEEEHECPFFDETILWKETAIVDSRELQNTRIYTLEGDHRDKYEKCNSDSACFALFEYESGERIT